MWSFFSFYDFNLKFKTHFYKQKCDPNTFANNISRKRMCCAEIDFIF